MITEHDLQEAIAACEGERKPNAATCIKLAAFYTIRDQMFPVKQFEESVVYPRYSGADRETAYESDTDFGQAVQGMRMEDLMPIMDELMSAIQVLNPRLYDSVMRKLFDN